MKFSTQETVDLVTFTEEILNRKLYFLCSDSNDHTVNHVKHNSCNFVAEEDYESCC